MRNFGAGPDEVAKRFLSLYPDTACDDALRILQRDFLDPESVGVLRATAFLRGEGVTDDELQADIAGFIQRFVDLCA